MKGMRATFLVLAVIFFFFASIFGAIWQSGVTDIFYQYAPVAAVVSLGLGLACLYASYAARR